MAKRGKKHMFAIVHDHLVQRGGAERVVPVIAAALDAAPVHTALHEPSLTHAEVAEIEVRAGPLNRVRWLRFNHRWAFPLLASEFWSKRPAAEVTLFSTVGWAHLARARGRSVAYWYAPARWLYEIDLYVGTGLKGRAVRSLAPILEKVDRRAVSRIGKHLAISTSVAQRLRDVYGVEATVVHPPVTFQGQPEPMVNIEPGYFLAVSRLLSYKNIDVVIAAMRHLPDRKLVVVGVGPEQDRLEAMAGDNVTFVGQVSDDQLAWLYQSCTGLVTVAYEDFGLTPLEAGLFGKPSVALEEGGFLDTIIDGSTGLFVRDLDPRDLAMTMEKLESSHWDGDLIRRHARRFSVEGFMRNIRAHCQGEQIDQS